MKRLVPLVRRHWFDAVVVAMAAWGAVDGYLNPIGWQGIDKGPEWLVVGAGPVLALPLLARRRAPVLRSTDAVRDRNRGGVRLGRGRRRDVAELLHAALARALRTEEQAERAVEEERARITRELHDVLAHSVSVMTVQASAVRRLLAPQQEREREALLAVEETGRQALVEMRRLLGIMRTDAETAARAPQPGIGTLPQLVEQVRQSGLPVELTVEGEPVKLAAGVDLSAYRIVQEALTNALKHGDPAHAWVAVRYGGEDVEIEVANDGTARARATAPGTVSSGCASASFFAAAS